jgi:ubiquinone/menaquinone biosynthesis C-methylase UbiE
MTVAIESGTVLAFDRLAAKYDDMFTRSMVGRAQRQAVWDVLLETIEPGSHILELNCGTGEDALFLAQHDMSVVACDASVCGAKTRRPRSSSGISRQSSFLSSTGESCSTPPFRTFPD